MSSVISFPNENEAIKRLKQRLEFARCQVMEWGDAVKASKGVFARRESLRELEKWKAIERRTARTLFELQQGRLFSAGQLRKP